MSRRSLRSTFNTGAVKGLVGLGAGAGALGATAARVVYGTDLTTTTATGFVTALALSGAAALLHHTLEG